MKKFLFLVNPISGTVRKQGIVELIEKTCTERGLDFSIAATEASGDYSLLRERVIQEGYTHIGLVGGDGTVNQVANGLCDLPVSFGIIPMGSGNGLALTAGISTIPAVALDLILTGKSRPIDAFRVNGAFSCMLSGLGFDAQVAHDFANKASRGLLTYTRQTLINYFSARPYAFDVAIQHFSFATEAYFISIANSNQFGNRVTIAPQASLHDGLLDVVVVQKMNKALLPFAILSQLRGMNKIQVMAAEALKRNILYFQTPSLSIRNWQRAPLHIDGEPRKTADRIDINVMSKCFRLIQP